LKGREIPISARIFTVVDVWDALTNDRPYRGKWSEDRVREYIAQESGTHFDPDVVEEFFKMIDEMGYQTGSEKPGNLTGAASSRRSR
jgi:response regulator RpfG family c-di-GMP phosphodiesterase